MSRYALQQRSLPNDHSSSVQSNNRTNLSQYAQACVLKGFKPRRELVGTIDSITFYPLKSARGIEVDAIECLMSGLKVKDSELYDRHWVVVDTTNKNQFVTGRDEATITTVQPSFHGNKLHLDAKDMETLVIPKIAKSSKVIEAKFKLEYVKGVDCGDKAADWFCKFFGRPGFRLLFFGKKIEHRRLIDQTDDRWFVTAKPTDQLAYQNYTAFNLIAKESLHDLNRKLPEGTEKCTMDFFRPNFVVTGCGAFQEVSPCDYRTQFQDTWKDIFIGNSTFYNLKPRNACLLVIVDPVTGKVREDKEPMTTLRTYRLVVPDFKDAPAFGVMLVAEKLGTVHVGDKVYATKQTT
ncbi:hypothetical protein NP493_82g01052 [Ridgeia piscesae]|uniref:MOSC domain-containing protein n=1 Tax=Ridgeia piscesae TaxID=27915 RepID=A0AAD9P906_RIDPI|nr:hypothetical protein NP493_82g01052 [Ridgeia piscesae]